MCPGYKTVSDFVQKHFVPATNVSQFAQPEKHHGQQCVRNNVSSFARALKETHELIFSWLSWLAVLLVSGGVAQDGYHPPTNRLTETYSLGLPCAFLIYDIILKNWIIG